MIGKGIKLIRWSASLIKRGILLEFLTLVRADATTSSGQETILTLSNKICSQLDPDSAENLTLLEMIGDVYMRQHKFEEAIAKINELLRLMANYDAEKRSLRRSYQNAFECLASCYFNLKRYDDVNIALAKAEKMGIKSKVLLKLKEMNVSTVGAGGGQ